MKINKKVYLFEIVLLIFTIFLKIFNNNYHFSSYYLTSSIMWIIVLILLIISHGFPKSEQKFRNYAIKIILISLMCYILISYLLGIILGYSYSIYAHDFLSIIKNIGPIIILDVVIEIIRYLLLKRCTNKFQKVLLTIIFVINEILLVTNITFNNTEQVFIVLSVIIIPLIARQMLYSYITDQTDCIPTLIFRICVDTYIFIVPFIPNLGNYLSSVIGVLLPYIIYFIINKRIKYNKKRDIYSQKFFKKFMGMGLALLLAIIIMLVSGFFKYQIIAIASDSMQSIYGRGDAVIFEKIKPDKVKVGDILVFKVEKTIITHRVIRIENQNGNKTFITKGDNNDTIDKYKITDNNVIGIVRNYIKFIGYPTVWLNE